MIALASLVCGLILGFGLLTSGVTQPAKVQGFFDIFGRWDPTLAFVMAAALAVSGMGFALVRQRGRPVLSSRFVWPTRSEIDRPLVVGSILFGTGAGLVGVCPGAILVNLSTLMPSAVVLVLAMAAGMTIKDLWDRWKPSGIAAGGDRLSVSTDG
jgi:uncharacterized membrane protein YedE/YeeE